VEGSAEPSETSHNPTSAALGLAVSTITAPLTSPAVISEEGVGVAFRRAEKRDHRRLLPSGLVEEARVALPTVAEIFQGTTLRRLGCISLL